MSPFPMKLSADDQSDKLKLIGHLLELVFGAWSAGNLKEALK
jgi:hypothetical protein